MTAGSISETEPGKLPLWTYFMISAAEKVSHGVNTRTYFRTERRRHFEGAVGSQWRDVRRHVGKRTPLI